MMLFLLSSGGHVATQRKKELRGLQYEYLMDVGIIRFLAKTLLKAEVNCWVDLT